MRESSIEPLPPNWENYEVSYRHADGEIGTRYEIVHVPSGTRYMHEPLARISGKCVLLFLAAQFFGHSYMMWHFVRAPLVASAITIRSIWQAIQHPNWEQVTHTFIAVIWTAPLAFLQNIWGALRTHYFTWRIELAGLYGVVNPLEARQIIAEVEKKWHHRTRREDIRFYDDSFSRIWKGLFEPYPPSTLFLALCMQPIGTMPQGELPDRHLNIERMEKVIPTS